MRLRRGAARLLALVLAAGALAGCLQEELAANQRQLDQQKAQLERLEKEIADLRKAQNYASSPPPPGACDAEVARQATLRGGQRFAANDFGRALGYYQDAVTACPTSAETELNVARTYEALGRRAEAVEHYRRATQLVRPDEAKAAEQARQALSRLDATR